MSQTTESNSPSRLIEQRLRAAIAEPGEHIVLDEFLGVGLALRRRRVAALGRNDPVDPHEMRAVPDAMQ